MRELSLFSGAGGGLLATKHLLGWETIGYVEIDDYCQRVLAQRIKDGYLDNAPIFTDIRAFIDSGCAELYRGITDVITAGFPCQPWSHAHQTGEQAGAQERDERNLWPETMECLRLVRPRYALLENVPALLNHEYVRRIFGDLAESGFNVEWDCISASLCGANHRRKRWWALIHSGSSRRKRGRAETHWQASGKEFERLVQVAIQSGIPTSSGSGIHDGIPNRLDRLRTIGQAQVPAVVKVAWEWLSGR